MQFVKEMYTLEKRNERIKKICISLKGLYKISHNRLCECKILNRIGPNFFTKFSNWFDYSYIPALQIRFTLFSTIFKLAWYVEKGHRQENKRI